MIDFSQNFSNSKLSIRCPEMGFFKNRAGPRIRADNGRPLSSMKVTNISVDPRVSSYDKYQILYMSLDTI